MLLLLDVSDWHAFRHHVASPGTRPLLLAAAAPLSCFLQGPAPGTCGDQSAPASAEEHSGAVPGRLSESRAGSKGLGSDSLCGDLSSKLGSLPRPGRVPGIGGWRVGGGG